MAIIDDIKSIVNSYGAKFYDSEIVSDNGETIFRVYIVKDDGVNLDLCADISRDVSPLLDINAPVSGEYRFEVSSPGIERKLTKKEHFLNSIDSKVKVKVLGSKKLKGTLIDADDEGIKVETKDGIESFKYNELGTVKTYFEW